MTETTTSTRTDASAPVSRRYRSVNGPDGELVIYDGEDHRGWLQSDRHVALGAVR